MTVDTIFDDRAVYFPHDRLLVLADTHFGRYNHDPDRPTTGYDDVRDRIIRLVEKYDVERAILAGDVFDQSRSAEAEAVAAFKDICVAAADEGTEIWITPGNHEPVDGFDLRDTENVFVQPAVGPTDHSSVVVQHGHTVNEERGRLHVVGHVHPGYRRGSTIYPCYLHGTRSGNRPDTLVLPAFNSVVEGREIKRIDFGSDRSPLLSQPTLANDFQVFVWDAEIGEAVNVDVDGVV